jgi:hypothetical protein
MCPCVRQQASWEAQVIKLCEIWANIYPIFNLVIKTGESRGSSAPATIPSASRSKKTTRRTRAGRQDGSYCGRPACPRWRSSYVHRSRHRPQSSRVLHRCPGCAAVPCRPAGCFPCRRLGSYHHRADVRQHRSPGSPQPGLEAVAAALHGQAGPALLDTSITMNGT